jgi:hypothetical protein
MTQNGNTKEITSGSTDRRLTCLKERADQHEADCYEENVLNNVGQREGAERRAVGVLPLHSGQGQAATGCGGQLMCRYGLQRINRVKSFGPRKLGHGVALRL